MRKYCFRVEYPLTCSETKQNLLLTKFATRKSKLLHLIPDHECSNFTFVDTDWLRHLRFSQRYCCRCVHLVSELIPSFSKNVVPSSWGSSSSSMLILVINQLDRQNFCSTISLFHVSTCLSTMCSSSGGRPVHRCTGRPPIGVMIPEAV